MKGKTIIGLMAMMSVIVSGCSSEDISGDILTYEDSPLQISANEAAIHNYIRKVHKRATRGADIDLLPYAVNGDTVMFIANYPEGGFEIFSNDTSFPMILAKSSVGSYNPYTVIEKSPFDEFMEGAANNLSQIRESSETEDPNPTWTPYSIEPAAVDDNGGLQKVGIGCEISDSEFTPKGGRLETSWHQSSPYNQYIPLYTDGSNQHSIVGCGAVAVGQYIYHSHKYLNFPVHTVDKAVYNTSTNTYSFSGSSSTIWNDIKVSDEYSSLDEMLPTSLFLGNIANNLHTIFAQKPGEGSSSSTTNMHSYIEQVFSTRYYWKNLSVSEVIKALKGGHPVLTTSTGIITEKDGQKDRKGHAYLIDYVQETIVRYYNVYAYLDEDDWPYDREEPDDERGYGLTLDFYRERYGDITTQYTGNYIDYWLGMNWGWGGENNDIYINSKLATWNINHDKKHIEIDEFWILTE